MTRIRINRKELGRVTLLLFCAGGLVALFPLFGLRINTSSSHVPVGIWRAYPAGSIGVGDVVTYDVHDFFRAVPRVREERLVFRTPRFLKRVAALPGALIERSGDLVLIDKTAHAKIADESWCKVDYPLVVPKGTVWIMADSERAWDSRYHGPLPVALVREKNKPLLVWGNGRSDEGLHEGP
jgi:type IV secretory pathway protease TraF